VIFSEKFAGLNHVKAQQLVYQSVEEWMGKEIHALSMKTFVPDKWVPEEG
jgi:acid stress-induced BolA-like protein IbaG/YrbA